MKKLGMEKAFIIYVLVLLLISGAYYLTLPNEGPILREEGWNTDKSVLRGRSSSELINSYSVDNDTRGIFIVEQSLKYNITRITEKARLSELINTLKNASPEENKTQVNEYYESFLNKPLTSETSYLFALSNFKNATLVKEDREYVPGGTVPIVTNKIETQVNAIVLMYKTIDGSWEPVGVAHTENDEYITPQYVFEKIIQ
ncbi:hypothetical protein C9439_01055 [archaeon SCG-AAA382B04]|nr:hypothetical protein C9439_01055 [archaeon SCG-AAA382B04]